MYDWVMRTYFVLRYLHYIGKERSIVEHWHKTNKICCFQNRGECKFYLFNELKINRDESILHVPSEWYAYAPNSFAGFTFFFRSCYTRAVSTVSMKRSEKQFIEIGNQSKNVKKTKMFRFTSSTLAPFEYIYMTMTVLPSCTDCARAHFVMDSKNISLDVVVVCRISHNKRILVGH